MKVGIVGAGVSGLASAYRLRQLGHDVVVLEKSRQVGGRVNSRIHAEGFTFDVGATSIAPRGKQIQRVLLDELSTENLVRIEKPIWTHNGLRIAPGSTSKNSVERYTYCNGIQEFAKLLAADIDIRFSTEVDQIARQGALYVLGNDAYGAVILTPPVPQTAQLLWTLAESRPLANATYRCCISVMLGFKSVPIDPHYHALIDPEQVHPMTWLSIESTKSPGRAPDGGSAFVAQLSARFSQQNYAQPDSFFIDAVLSFLKHLYGEQFSHPDVAMVKKWKYSQPEGTARFEIVNPDGSKLVVSGDGTLGGRIEDAFEVGIRAAELIHG